MELRERVELEILRRETLAREASIDRLSGDWTMGGEHWQWVCSNCDTPAPITDVTVLDELLECPNCRSVGLDLRSVERYNFEKFSHPRRGLPHFITNPAEEVSPVAALYIVTHDPASMLLLYRKDLRVLERHVPAECGQSARGHRWCSACDPGGSDYNHTSNWPCIEIVDMADAYGVKP